jgi:hypothetical protein
MAQFDYIIIFPVFWSLILVLILNYVIIIEFFLPKFCSLLKFRKKFLVLAKLKISPLYEISNY